MSPPPAFTKNQVYHALNETFGHTDFRPGQADIIRSILRGRPTIAVLPTGAGKSLCYQLPALLLEGTTLVISPLIALMQDQVSALRKLGIAAACIHSALPLEELHQAEADFRAGTLKLLYISPERLNNSYFQSLLQQAPTPTPLVAVDEAHCVSQWGHDFRPDYLQIGPFLQHLNPHRRAAFTATATPELREELGVALQFEDPQLFIRGFRRENLRLSEQKFTNEEARRDHAVGLVQNRPGNAPALIYAGTRKACEELTEELQRNGLTAAYYHGGCTGEARRQAQEDYQTDQLDALVATNAFGMGVDKADVRLLIHLHLPQSFEDYYQEFGRAGRDGQPAQAVLLWRGKDYRTWDFLIRQGSVDGTPPTPEVVEGGLRRLGRIYDWVQGGTCSWRRVLEYFGDPEASEMTDGCGTCCRCERAAANPKAALTGLNHEAARILLQAVRQWPVQYGKRKTVQILKGSRAAGIPMGLDYYGELSTWSAPKLTALLQALMDEAYVVSSGSEYPVVGVSAKGVAALDDGEILVSFASEEKPVKKMKSERTAVSEKGLEGSLKTWRLAQAQEFGIPAFHVINNRTLIAIANARPMSEEELLAISGMGPVKVEKFGADVLALVAEA